MTSTQFLVGYIAIFVGFFAVVAFWRRRSRTERKPFPDQTKLLRGPGETQRRRIAQLDESALVHVAAALIGSLAVAGALLWLTTSVEGPAQVAGLAITGVVLVAGLLFLALRLVRGVDEWRNRTLGFFGERIVAEALEPLKAQGYRVFHDLPAGETGKTFNIDHVIVGPGGVFAVETKTRRKRNGAARAGVAEHEIIYDGQVLAYPWGEDRHGLEQSQRQAKWLETLLAQLTGQPVAVGAILTFPGWTILRRGTGAVNVLAPREIPAAVTASATNSGHARVLDDAQIDLIARQLDHRCRDVEF